MSEYDTRPTIETVLESINALRFEMLAGFKEVKELLEELDRKHDVLDERVDIFIREVLDIKRNLRRPA